MALIESGTSSQTDVHGSQRPRLCQVPEYVSSAGDQAIALAAMAGLYLDPWEAFVLDASLGEREDGKWAAYEVGLVVPRQNGKGSILEARELAGLFLLGEELIIHSAHEQKTATNHFRRLLRLIENVPEFDRRVLKAPQGRGSEAIVLRGGQQIFFQTRTGGGGRGLTGDLVVLDEAMILPTAVTAALVPTMAARSIIGNPQMWYAGSSVDQQRDQHGEVLARVRARGLNAAPRLAYFEWSVEGDDPDRVPEGRRRDPDLWAEANPGMGIRISAEHIENECEGALGPREFCVERLGIGDWPDITSGAGRVIPLDKYEAAAEIDTSKRITGRRSFSIDVNPDRTWGAIGVGGVRDDGLTQVAIVAHERGTGWIVDRCLDLKASSPRCKFFVDKRGPAANLIPAMQEARLPVVEISTEEYAKACSGIFDAFDQNTVRYPSPQPELADALAGARKAPMGDAWKWSRKDSSAPDITPLVTVTIAYWAAALREKRARIINLNDL